MINNILKIASGSMSSIASMSSKAGEAASSSSKKILGVSLVIGAVGTAVYNYSSLTQEEKTKIFEDLKEKILSKKSEDKTFHTKAPTSSVEAATAPAAVVTSGSANVNSASAPQNQSKSQETKPQGNVADSPPPASVTSDDKVTTSYLGAWNISWNTKTVVAVSAVAAVSLACIAAVFSGN